MNSDCDACARTLHAAGHALAVLQGRDERLLAKDVLVRLLRLRGQDDRCFVRRAQRDQDADVCFVVNRHFMPCVVNLVGGPRLDVRLMPQQVLFYDPARFVEAPLARGALRATETQEDGCEFMMESM